VSQIYNNKESLYIAQKQALAVVRLCSPLFSTTCIQSFLFIKISPNKKMVALSTHASWLRSLYTDQSWLESNVVQQAFKKVSRLSYFAQLWSRDQGLFRQLDLQQGLNLWQRSGDDILCWSFGVFDRVNNIDDLITILDDLKIFANHFEKQAAVFIDNVQSCSCELNKNYDDHLLQSKDAFAEFIQQTPIKHFPIIYNDKKFNLTYKQALCLQGLCEGKGSKALAKEMGVSPRTVEKHLENIKDHLNIRQKNEVLSIYKASRDSWL